MQFRCVWALALQLPMYGGGGADGNYPIYARLLANTVGKYLPGQPNFVIEAQRFRVDHDRS